MKTKKRDRLVRIVIVRGHNADGEREFLVTPIYQTNGRIVSVPPDRGFPTREQAVAEAERIAGGKLER